MGSLQSLCSASLSLWSDAVGGAALRECLEARAELVHFEKGSFIGNSKLRYKKSKCRLKSPGFVEGELALRWLMERVVVREPFWEFKRSGLLLVELSFEVTSEGGRFPSLHIDASAMNWLHALGAEIDIDILY